jgi:hypothetical protein
MRSSIQPPAQRGPWTRLALVGVPMLAAAAEVVVDAALA